MSKETLWEPIKRYNRSCGLFLFSDRESVTRLLYMLNCGCQPKDIAVNFALPLENITVEKFEP